MTETIEQLCQRTMETRGYLVLQRDRPAKIGERVEFVNGTDDLDSMTASMVVIAQTDADDAESQAKMWGVSPVDRNAFYYRVIAE